ncbi:MAG: M28 family peptidase, partial [Ignavibacteriales bacterium]|nr:M28 family peptidase [Ignavibacteriales bacterium]
YRQPVKMSITALGEEHLLHIAKGTVGRDFAIKSDFTPYEMTASKEVKSQVVFAGYGITAPEYNYDDYAGFDVAGKIVFVLRHEPREEDTTSVFNGRKATKYSDVIEKVRIAKEHGAAALLVATDPLNHSSLNPRGFPWPSLSKTIPKDALPLTLSVDEPSKIPVVQVGEEVISLLFGSVDSLKILQEGIDRAMAPRSFSLTDVSADVKTSTLITSLVSTNVMGVLEGSDSTWKNEYIVVGAHYDHVGMRKNHEPGEDYIFNGADDNASGTACVLGVAAAFGKLKNHPKRSILFVTFAGEEKGLFGSSTYVDHPPVPLAQTVAMLNMDMVGRNSIDSLILIGTVQSPDIATIVRMENESVGFVLQNNQDKYLGGSDHASFMKKGIPFMFFHSGMHPQYHQVGDEASLIDGDKDAKVGRLVFRTALHIANDTKRYTLTSTAVPAY